MTNKYTIWLSDWMLKQYPHTWQCPKAVNDAVGKLVIKILFAGGWWEE